MSEGRHTAQDAPAASAGSAASAASGQPDLPGAVVADAAPGAVAAISQEGRRVLSAAAGAFGPEPGAPPAEVDTIFDLASVSKVFTSATVLTLVADGRLALEDRVGRFFPHAQEQVAAVSVRQLLTHTAGLPSVPELHRWHPGRDDLERALRALAPVRPPGSEVAYTSLGYQWLGWIVEAASGASLDDYMRAAVLEPCGLRETRFLPAGEGRGRIAPAGWSIVRERVLQGEVHDENAWILGGVCGHTGLFADAEQVLRLGEALLYGDWLGDARAFLFEDLTGGLTPARSAAFVRDDPQFGAPGCTTWSHTGYTGTSLCLLPQRDTAVVLLTNRVHPARGNERIVEARAAFHAAAYELLQPTTPRIP